MPYASDEHRGTPSLVVTGIQQKSTVCDSASPTISLLKGGRKDYAIDEPQGCETSVNHLGYTRTWAKNLRG